MKAASALTAIKLLHTLVWAFFVACIVAIPAFAYQGRLSLAAALIAVVMFEVLVLAINRGRCPLTGVAARYTDDRPDNFDIYLPVWVARYNKLIFGMLYLGGVSYTIWQWWR
jgi:hypothetical protein